MSAGLTCFNFRQQVASDIAEENHFLPPQNVKSNQHLGKIVDWTDNQMFQLNEKKTKYMIFNCCTKKKFQTRLFVRDTLIEQVNESRLLGVIISDNLTWHANTNSLVKRAYARMSILRRLYEFNVPQKQMVQIYTLYVRSITEQSSVVWSSSITQDESCALERTQKVALKIIFRGEYV